MDNDTPNFKKFRRQIEAVVNERANRIANQVSAEIVDIFAQQAKLRLEKASKDFSPESAHIISSLQDNIFVEKQDLSSVNKTTGKKKERIYASVRIKKDPQNLLMYLEYGTGLVGEKNSHPEAGKVGWEYALNRENYKTLPYSNTGQGWFFTKKPNSIILKNDIPIHSYVKTERIVKHQIITIKKGKNAGKTYERNQPYVKRTKSSRSVFSEGIKPIRFIYDTKQEIKRLFDVSKGTSTVEEFRIKLKTLDIK